MFLNKDQILKADDLAVEIVDVPEWGKDAQVRVKAMSGVERDRFEASICDGEKVDRDNIRAKAIASSLVDENNELLFSDADIEFLGNKSAKPLDRIFTVVQRLSGIGKDDVDELAKNS